VLIPVRLSPTEVQAGRFIYAFEEPNEADCFEACVAAVNVRYCEQKHPCARKTYVDARGRGAADYA
jgi:hypothetical protein